MSNIGIALQLYTLRDLASRDLAGTLAQVRETGFEYVQWSGLAPLAASDIRAALASAGLKAIGGHCTADELDQDIDAVIAHWQEVGVPDVAITAPPAGALDSPASWRAWAERAAESAQRFADVGMRLACHHHAAELHRPSPNDPHPLDTLLAITAETPLGAEFDTGWILLGGADPAETIRPYPDRCPLLHVKDVAAGASAAQPAFVALGTGIMDLQAVFDAAEEIGVEWYVYEQDTPGAHPFED
ncbi:MAG: sugar phosphate isomerase/epimerase, partial [Candidatus Hydrogenedentes bacterium]|nr:sugar phosphate isomerase/epimerase [Candidatus Hydrogenedentota bacterium]